MTDSEGRSRIVTGPDGQVAEVEVRGGGRLSGVHVADDERETGVGKRYESATSDAG